jgi:hypothetical protein
MTMNSLVPISEARAPAAMRERMKQQLATNRNFTDNVVESFPMLSIKGKVFAKRQDGLTQQYVDASGYTISFLDVVLVNASRLLAKAYYSKGFEDTGDFSPPDCWSLDSVRPDPSVAFKVNPTCANCPKNAFGSAPSRDPGSGKRGGKACQDYRRVAVLMPAFLGRDVPPTVFLLKVPQTSLKNMKGYVTLLERQGWEPAACVTRLSFDNLEAYPKLKFDFVDALDEAEYAQVVDIAESPSTAAMLVAPDFDNSAAPPPPNENPNLEARVRQEAPVLVDDATVPPRRNTAEAPPPRREQAPEPQPAPVHTQAASPAAVASTLVELPDGKLYDTATGKFVERPQPKVEMPSLDPDTIALPDGRFFNRKTSAFVTGPEVGAAAVTAKEPPKRPAAKANKPKREAPVTKTEAKPQGATVKVEERQAAPQTQDESSESDSGPVDNSEGNGVDMSITSVQPASADLDSMLRSILPPRK